MLGINYFEGAIDNPPVLSVSFRWHVQFSGNGYDPLNQDKINSENNYTREYGIFLIKKILEKMPSLNKIVPYLLQLDINSLLVKVCDIFQL